jgi:ferredoxin-NADP reductase
LIAKVRVLRSWRETPTTHGIRLARPPGFDFRPVQFVGLELATAEGPIEYSMSLASSPTRDHLEFGARIASGTPWKRAFAALREDDVVEIDGPYGRFLLDETRPAVLIAGGIGVTPLKGMAEYAADRRLPVPVTLLYSNRSPEEIAYRAELEALERANPRFRVVHTITRPAPGSGWTGRTGRIDGPLLAEMASAEAVHYVCGTPGMVEEVVGRLLEQGIDRTRIRFEEFWGYE